jgi:hypothetical protein
MTELLSIYWGLIFIFVLAIIKIIIIFVQTEDTSTTFKLGLIFNYFIDFKVILTLIISGFAILVGINFFLSSISSNYPINLQIEENQVYIFLIGGVSVILSAVYATFHEEINAITESKRYMKEKIPINHKFITFCHEYTRYKEKTSNPELSVMKFFDKNTILVNTSNVRDYITENLYFDLKIFESITYNDQPPFDARSLNIAKCQFISSGKEHTYFKIIEWTNTTRYEEQIKKLLTNTDFHNLKPVITLSEDPIAEKCTYNEIDKLQKTLSKLKMIMEGY